MAFWADSRSDSTRSTGRSDQGGSGAELVQPGASLKIPSSKYAGKKFESPKPQAIQQALSNWRMSCKVVWPRGFRFHFRKALSASAALLSNKIPANLSQ